MNRVVHFEIHAADPKRAIEFYSKLFGWKFEPYGPPDFYWLITTGEKDTPGINGGLVRRRGPNPDPKDPTPVVAFVGTVDVADIDAASRTILAAGGIAAVPKQVIPGVGFTAYFKDTESDIFGVFQTDPNAK